MIIESHVGRTFGKLTVMSEAPRMASGNRRVFVKCSCGSPVKSIQLNQLTSGQTSCGCVGKKMRAKANTTHGMTGHKLHVAWLNMKGRCLRDSHPDYKNYGGRGVTICAGWINNAGAFIDFCLSNGWIEGKDIDRINNDGGYEPGNIRFVSRSVNLSNTRLLRANNVLGYRGVSRCREKFVARCNFGGNIVLQKGGFSTAIEAAKFRDNYCQVNGIQAPLNFPKSL